MEIEPGHWHGKRVLVTGHTGFKGAWLCYWLHKLGAQVAGVSLDPETSPNLYEALALADILSQDYRNDINDINALQTIFDKIQPEIVLHLAAQAIVIDSYNEPVNTFATNIMGTVNVLEVARHTKSVKAVLVVTSDKCYENENNVRPHIEDDALGGIDPYSASKAGAELVVASYRASFLNEAGIAIASARAGNVIGGGDWSRFRLLPDCVRSFQSGQPVVLRNPRFIRPWQHVLDSLSGYIKLCQCLMADNNAAYRTAWNFAPDRSMAVTVGDVAHTAAAAWGDGAQVEIDETTAVLKESRSLQLDAGKAEVELHWMAHWSGLVGVSKTIDWYKSFNAGLPAREICDQQLAAYALDSAP